MLDPTRFLGQQPRTNQRVVEAGPAFDDVVAMLRGDEATEPYTWTAQPPGPYAPDHLAPADAWYMTENGDRLFFPVLGWSWNAAQHEAGVVARDIVGEPWSRAQFVGRQDTRLHDHDGWEDCVDDEFCPPAKCYVFDVVER